MSKIPEQQFVIPACSTTTTPGIFNLLYKGKMVNVTEIMCTSECFNGHDTMSWSIEKQSSKYTIKTNELNDE